MLFRLHYHSNLNTFLRTFCDEEYCRKLVIKDNYKSDPNTHFVPCCYIDENEYSSSHSLLYVTSLNVRYTIRKTYRLSRQVKGYICIHIWSNYTFGSVPWYTCPGYARSKEWIGVALQFWGVEAAAEHFTVRTDWRPLSQAQVGLLQLGERSSVDKHETLNKRTTCSCLSANSSNQ